MNLHARYTQHRRSLLACLCAGIVLTTIFQACDLSEDALVPPAPAVFGGIWQGTYVSTSMSDSGLFMMELFQEGSDVTGELVFRPTADFRRIEDARVKGRIQGDHLSVELDRSSIPYQYDLSLQLNLTDSIRSSGTFFFSPDSLSASVRCSKPRKGSMVVVDSIIINDYIRSLAFDGDRLWMSTMEYFLTAPILPGDLDTTIITISIGAVTDLRWTSSTLASNGTFLWGDLPASINQGANYSHILSFDTVGSVLGSFDIPHRTSGLAHDGASLWTFCYEPNKLYRLSSSGALVDSIAVAIPDATHLEYAENSFWFLGWHLKKLYRLGLDGTIQAVYELPRDMLNLYSLGIAFDGTYFWYARELPSAMGRASILYRLHLL